MLVFIMSYDGDVMQDPNVTLSAAHTYSWWAAVNGRSLFIAANKCGRVFG